MSQPPEAPGYLVQTLLGEGGFGIVYAGLQLASNQRVALKFFKRGFSHELEGLVRLGEHPFIAPVLDANADHDPPYLVTHLLKESLGAYLKRRDAPAEVDKASRWLEQVVRALHFIHQRGVSHCDLKPDNVLLDDEEQARLIDFGQSTARGQKANLGTAFYMPAEQVVSVILKTHKPTPGWDVYALGATFYRALTGAIPRECSLDGLGDKVNAAWLAGYRRLLMQQPLVPVRTLNAGVDTRLAMIIERCLEISPTRRYESAADILDDLEFRSSRRPHVVDEVMYRFGQARFRAGLRRSPESDMSRHTALCQLFERLLGSSTPQAFILERGLVVGSERLERSGRLRLADVSALLRELADLRISDDRETLSASLRYLGVRIRLLVFRGTVALVDCEGPTRGAASKEPPELAALLRKLDARRGVLLLGAGMKPLLAARQGVEPASPHPLADEQLTRMHRHLPPRQLEGFFHCHFQPPGEEMRAAIYLPKERA